MFAPHIEFIRFKESLVFLRLLRLVYEMYEISSFYLSDAPLATNVRTLLYKPCVQLALGLGIGAPPPLFKIPWFSMVAGMNVIYGQTPVNYQLLRLSVSSAPLNML